MAFSILFISSVGVPQLYDDSEDPNLFIYFPSLLFYFPSSSLFLSFTFIENHTRSSLQSYLRCVRKLPEETMGGAE